MQVHSGTDEKRLLDASGIATTDAHNDVWCRQHTHDDGVINANDGVINADDGK